jgi:asparagine synthase (glutamine-hydrolysing)
MCGIAGMIWTDPQRVGDAEPLEEALAAIWRRGPDGQGTLIRPGITAGMRRLAIIDLEGGQQPIFNETGDVGVLFNGEIYNFRELRKRCEARGHVFRTRSDTEVLVHLYEDQGPDFVSLLNGMFAFVIWDGPARRALLARDRFGIKPLHIARTHNGLAFASEVKALAAAKWVSREINRDTLSAYMRFGWVPDQGAGPPDRRRGRASTGRGRAGGTVSQRLHRLVSAGPRGPSPSYRLPCHMVAFRERDHRFPVGIARKKNRPSGGDRC